MHTRSPAPSRATARDSRFAIKGRRIQMVRLRFSERVVCREESDAPNADSGRLDTAAYLEA